MAGTKSKSAGIPGKPPTQNRIISMLDEIGRWKGYVSSLRSKSKQRTKSAELMGEFRPDLIMRPAIGWKTSARVVEVESTVNNHTISKSIFSLLDHMARHEGSKGFLVVPSRGSHFAADRVKAIQEIMKRFRRGGKGKKRRVPIDVLTFDQVRKYHAVLSAYVQKPRRGQPPKFKGFDD